MRIEKVTKLSKLLYKNFTIFRKIENNHRKLMYLSFS